MASIYQWLSSGTQPAAAEGDLGCVSDTQQRFTYTGGVWVADETVPIVDNRTDDPSSPATGQMWLRTDL